MKSLRLLLNKRDLFAYCFLIFLSFAFFWKYFLKGLVPIPADTIVGIYYPWRDHIWNGLVAGVPIKNGLLSDIVSIIYPWRIYGIELLKKGIWPLWIPHALAGAPLLANFQSGLFYPLNFLFFLLSNVNAWSIYIVLQPVLASVFCFAFLRNLRLNTLSSLIGSFIFAFSGFMQVWLEYGIIGHAGLWLPLVLLGIDKILTKPSILWVVIGSLAIGFSLLAGYPQISVFLLFVSFLYGIWQLLTVKGKRNQRMILVFLFLFILGIALASIQLIPAFELWQDSIRQVDTSAEAFNYGLNPISKLILFFAPDFYGNPGTGNYWGEGAYNESVSYISIAGFLLAIIAFFGIKKKGVLLFFKALLPFSLLMAFANPLSNLVYSLRLPILASTSAGRFLFIAGFCLAILAAFGADLILLKKKSKFFFRSLLIIFVSFLIFSGIILFQSGLWPEQDLLTNLSVVRRNLILPTALLLTSLVLLVGARLIPFLKIKKITLLFLFFLIIFDLFRFGFKYNPFVNKNYLYPETELTNFLKKQSGFNRFTGLIPPSMFISYNLSSPEGYDPLVLKRYSEFANQINEEEFKFISAGRRWVIINQHESPLLNLLGSKFLLSSNPQPKSDWDPWYFQYPEEKYQLVFQYGYSQIYENREALPRAFIVHNFRVLTDEEILRTLMDKYFEPRETLLLEEKPLNSPEEKLGEEEVEINQSSYFDNQILIKTKSFADGFLFLSDNYYPGWKAYIDGRETEIYRANYTFRAVFIPQGEHKIEFLFQPQSFKLGLVISMMTVLILGGLISWMFVQGSALLKRK